MTHHFMLLTWIDKFLLVNLCLIYLLFISELIFLESGQLRLNIKKV